jgi:hypothetical protein
MDLNFTSETSEAEERRLRYERRQYSYADHIPERRSGQDRRDEVDNANPENSEQ